MEIVCRTDLACEALDVKKRLPDGTEYESFSSDRGTLVERVFIPEEVSEVVGKASGNYVTVSCGKIHELDSNGICELASIVSRELVRLIEKAIGKTLDFSTDILVVGLGNSSMTPDAIGPDTVKDVIATRHISELDPALFESFGCCRVSSLTPGVLGQTGMESAELVGAAVRCTGPDAVIIIDALAAKSLDRLGSTFQISDAGIRPGSGIGNRRGTLSEKTLGAPVIAVGIPTVVDSSTLIYDTLSKGGMDKISKEVRLILENGKSFFVSPKDCDEIVRASAGVLSMAINTAFGINV